MPLITFQRHPLYQVPPMQQWLGFQSNVIQVGRLLVIKWGVFCHLYIIVVIMSVCASATRCRVTHFTVYSFIQLNGLVAFYINLRIEYFCICELGRWDKKFANCRQGHVGIRTQEKRYKSRRFKNVTFTSLSIPINLHPPPMGINFLSYLRSTPQVPMIAAWALLEHHRVVSR